MSEYRWETWGSHQVLTFKGKLRLLSGEYSKEFAAYIYTFAGDREHAIVVYTPDGAQAIRSTEHMSLDQCKEKCLTLAMLYGW